MTADLLMMPKFICVLHLILVKARPLVKRAYQKKILFLNQNICWVYLKEPSQWDCSFEHPKQMLNLMGKKILTIKYSNIVFI